MTYSSANRSASSNFPTFSKEISFENSKARQFQDFHRSFEAGSTTASRAPPGRRKAFRAVALPYRARPNAIPNLFDLGVHIARAVSSEERDQKQDDALVAGRGNSGQSVFFAVDSSTFRISAIKLPSPKKSESPTTPANATKMQTKKIFVRSESLFIRFSKPAVNSLYKSFRFFSLSCKKRFYPLQLFSSFDVKTRCFCRFYWFKINGAAFGARDRESRSSNSEGRRDAPTFLSQRDATISTQTAQFQRVN